MSKVLGLQQTTVRTIIHQQSEPGTVLSLQWLAGQKNSKSAPTAHPGGHSRSQSIIWRSEWLSFAEEHHSRPLEHLSVDWRHNSWTFWEISLLSTFGMKRKQHLIKRTSSNSHLWWWLSDGLGLLLDPDHLLWLMKPWIQPGNLEGEYLKIKTWFGNYILHLSWCKLQNFHFCYFSSFHVDFSMNHLICPQSAIHHLKQATIPMYRLHIRKSSNRSLGGALDHP